MRLRNKVAVVGAGVAGLVAVSGVAGAAGAAYFASSTSTPAVTGVNTGSGDGGLFTHSSTASGSGVTGYASASTGSTNGVYGRSNSHDGNGVKGLSTASSPFGFGLFGDSLTGTGAVGRGPTGVLGLGQGTEDPGCVGVSAWNPMRCETTNGVVGQATTGVLGIASGKGAFDRPPVAVGSAGDLALRGYLVEGDAAGNWFAGSCTVPAGSTSQTCRRPAPSTSFDHYVVVTPQTNPGSAYWATADANGITISLAQSSAAAVTFNWLVVDRECVMQVGGCID